MEKVKKKKKMGWFRVRFKEEKEKGWGLKMIT